MKDGYTLVYSKKMNLLNKQIRPKVFIVTVNWNNDRDTLDCINSLLTVDHDDKKIVLVDNGSENQSMERIINGMDKNVSVMIYDTESFMKNLNDDYPLTIIRLSENLGFGGACNVGIEFAINRKADYVLLINNDTIATHDFLPQMLKTALTNDNIGLVGGKIQYHSYKSKVWFSGGYVNMIKGAFYHRENDCSGERESDFITGCLMLIPSQIIKKVGYFDERYFLNVEDVDLSYRIKAANYRLVVNCAAVVYHKVSASIGGLYSARNQYYFHRNRMLFFNKKLKGIRKIIFYFFQFFLLIPLWMLIQLLNGRTEALKGAYLGYYDFIRRHFGKCAYF